MEQAKRVRIVKREQRDSGAPSADAARRAATPARDARDVVSGWVREHQRRSEEFRQNYSTLLSQFGFSAPWAGREGTLAAAAPALFAGK